MAIRTQKNLGELTALQLSILNVLWERGAASVNEVHEALEQSHGLARKTIGTLLARLAKQRVLSFHEDGRLYIYRPTVTRDEVRHARMSNLVGGLFGGDLPALVRFALTAGEIEPEDLKRLHQMLSDHARKP